MDVSPPSYEDVMSGRANKAPPSYEDFVIVNSFVKKFPFLSEPGNEKNLQLTWRIVYCVYKAQKPFRRPPMCQQEEENFFQMNYLLHIAAFLAACEILLGTSDEIIIEKVPNVIFFLAWKNNAMWVPASTVVHREIEKDDVEELFRAISQEVAL